jgi:ketopantoate reductase
MPTPPRPRFKSDIRIKKDNGRKVEPEFAPCGVPGCAKPGNARVPKSRENLTEYVIVCAAHARAFNESWDFFKGMGDGDVQKFREEALFGHRPTWPMGKRAARARTGQGNPEFHDGHAVLGEDGEPGHVRRAAGKSGEKHTVFRAGEVHGRITERLQEVTRLVSLADSALATNNIWGERWSKLVTNAMANGMSASTGLVSKNILTNDALRRFGARLGSEAIRVGQALGYQLEEVHHIDPEIIARAGEGDAAATKEYDEHRLAEVAKAGGGEHRPSMGQDMVKGRRTEIEFLNGLIVRKGEEIGIATPANAALVDIVKRVEKGELQADPKHILDLRLN